MKKISSFLAKATLLSVLFLTIAPLATSNTAAAQSSITITTTGVSTADSNALVDSMCRALNIVTGSGGKAFAAFAIITVGVGFFTGKISWGLLIGVALGIAAMFGAPTIVSAINGKSTVSCGSVN